MGAVEENGGVGHVAKGRLVREHTTIGSDGLEVLANKLMLYTHHHKFGERCISIIRYQRCLLVRGSAEDGFGDCEDKRKQQKLQKHSVHYIIHTFLLFYFILLRQIKHISLGSNSAWHIEEHITQR